MSPPMDAGAWEGGGPASAEERAFRAGFDAGAQLNHRLGQDAVATRLRTVPEEDELRGLLLAGLTVFGLDDLADPTTSAPTNEEDAILAFARWVQEGKP